MTVATKFDKIVGKSVGGKCPILSSPVRFILIIQSNIESDQKMIQFNIPFSLKYSIQPFIQEIGHKMPILWFHCQTLICLSENAIKYLTTKKSPTDVTFEFSHNLLMHLSQFIYAPIASYVFLRNPDICWIPVPSESPNFPISLRDCGTLCLKSPRRPRIDTV